MYDRAKSRISEMESSARQRAGEAIARKHGVEPYPSSSASTNSDDGSEKSKQVIRKNNNTISMQKTRLWRKTFVDELQIDTEERCKHFKILRSEVDKKYDYLRHVYSKLQQECRSICETLRPSDFDTLPDSIRNMCISFNLKPCLPDADFGLGSPHNILSTTLMETELPMKIPLDNPNPHIDCHLDVEMAHAVPTAPLAPHPAGSVLTVSEQPTTAVVAPSITDCATFNSQCDLPNIIQYQKQNNIWLEGPPTLVLDVVPVTILKDPLAENGPDNFFDHSSSPVSMSPLSDGDECGEMMDSLFDMDAGAKHVTYCTSN